LGATLELLQWKAKNGVSNKGFGELLTIAKKTLLKENELPATTYAAKQVLCPLGLEIQKIYACPKDRILYRDEYGNLDACLVCRASWYKIKRDDPSDVEGNGERPRKRIPAWQVDVVCSYNTMLETFLQKQRACKVVGMARRRP
jgi:hypothetical protein